MENKIICLVVIIMFLLTVFTSVTAIKTNSELLTNTELKESNYNTVQNFLENNFQPDNRNRIDYDKFPKYDEHSIIVKLKDDIDIDYGLNILQSFSDESDNDLSLSILYSDYTNTFLGTSYNLKNVNKQRKELDRWIKIETNDKRNIISELKQHDSLDEIIEYTEHNLVYRCFNTPNDPFYSKQWYLHQSKNHDIDAPESWSITTGDSEIIVAVIDTGIDYNHPDLADNIWINTDEIPDNDIDDDYNGYIDDYYGWNYSEYNNDPKDNYGHGTHCAGIIAASGNNNIGITGVSWNSKIMCIKAGEYYFYNEDIARAIIYSVDNGAKVISMSFGSEYPSKLIEDALNYASANGVVLVAAAGNDALIYKNYPAAYDNVIAVAATNEKDQKAYFSSYGGWVDVAAPGTNIYSTMPTYKVELNDRDYQKNYDFLNGTSMACPVVAGLSALLLSNNDSMSPDMIKTIICGTCDKILTEKKSKGGMRLKIADDDDNYIVNNVGNGRVNAFEALKRKSSLAILDNNLLHEDIKGVVDISGSVWGETFLSYKLSIGKGLKPAEWIELENSTASIIENTLFILDTAAFEDGSYTIKLFVECMDGVYVDTLHIVVNNNLEVIEVDDDGDKEYSSIIDAVLDAGNGDEIFVYNGIYEITNICFIEKSIDITGEDKEKTIIQGVNHYFNVFYITSDFVNISNLAFKYNENIEPELPFMYGIWYRTRSMIFICSDDTKVSNCIFNDEGIKVELGSNTVIQNCNFDKTNTFGIWLDWGTNNTKILNCCYDGEQEIRLQRSSNITILNCGTENSKVALYIISETCTLRNNTLDHLWVACDHVYEAYHDIDTSNLVKGKPVYYLINKNDLIFDDKIDIGYLGFVSCDNITIKNLYSNRITLCLINLTNSIIYNCSYENCFHGFFLFYCYNCVFRDCYMFKNEWYGIYAENCYYTKFENCIFLANTDGIGLTLSNNNIIKNSTSNNNMWVGIDIYKKSDGNKISNSTISNNGIYGIYIGRYSNDNIIFYNNFIGNKESNAHLYKAEMNYWNNNSVGNYWDDYQGLDEDDNGIGDTSYVIQEEKNQDDYPLMNKIGDKASPSISVDHPKKGLYINDKKIIRLPFKTIIFGDTIIKVTASQDTVIVEFYIDDYLEKILYEEPFIYSWEETGYHNSLFHHEHKIKVVSYNLLGNSNTEEIIIRNYKQFW
jgi:subtilisin family serine protease